MTGRDADALARDPIAARGFGEAFGHSLGHGLGLEVHEAPRLSKTNPDPLPADAVVTIEPGVYLAGDGGVRIEDDVRSEEHTSELQSQSNLVCRLLLEKKKKKISHERSRRHDRHILLCYDSYHLLSMIARDSHADRAFLTLYHRLLYHPRVR